jgi:hypothetical protein
MNYLLVIHEERGQRQQRSQAEGQAAYDSMLGFAEALKQEGKLRGVESLQSDDRGRRVQVRNGEPRFMDGPFTEAKEMVGGFFLVECESLAEAAALAARCPAAAWATVEVRPVGPCWM